jgi:small subunit ribosomal protein S18
MRIKPRKPLRKSKAGAFLTARRRFCRFCTDKQKVIDYKELKTIEMFVKERGGIVSTRNTGNCAKHQRRMSGEIKKARFLSLIPYVRV